MRFGGALALAIPPQTRVHYTIVITAGRTGSARAVPAVALAGFARCANRKDKKIKFHQDQRSLFTMSEACNHDCSNCSANCESRVPQHEPPHAKSHIRKVIGVVSGKGGVGKEHDQRHAGCLDAPPGLQGRHPGRRHHRPVHPQAVRRARPRPRHRGRHPARQEPGGHRHHEHHLLLEDEEAPVVWRGPVIAGAVKQFCRT